MDMLTIFATQLVLSIFVYALIAKWYVVPWLADKPLEQVLIALIFPHALRRVGLTFFTPEWWQILCRRLSPTLRCMAI
jgi:hypothetical protein